VHNLISEATKDWKITPLA